MFTQRHYNVIARTMKACQPSIISSVEKGLAPSVEHRQHYACCAALADEMGKDNPNFNRNLFLYKCGGYVE